MVHPTPNSLVRHRHSAFRQQILDVTQAEGEPEVEPYRLLNDLGRESIPAVADLVHPRGATRPPRTPQARSAVTMPVRQFRGVDQPTDAGNAKLRDCAVIYRDVGLPVQARRVNDSVRRRWMLVKRQRPSPR